MSKNTNPPRYLSILVIDNKDEILDTAKVTFLPAGSRNDLVAEFNKETGLYVVHKLSQGHGRIKVEHADLDSQQRDVQIGDGETRETFILGEKGGQTFFRGKVRVPVTADPDLIGVVIERGARDRIDRLNALAESIGLKEEDVPDLAKNAGIRLFRAVDDIRAKALQMLTQEKAVEHAGIVVQMRETGFTFLTREVVVQFVGPRIEEVRAIAKEHNYALQRELVYAGGTFVLEWQGNPDELLNSIEKLAARKDVSWAEPSVVVTPELDAITPGDTLWNGLWDRQLIGLPDAWQNLQNAGLDTFGDPDIVLAVWDSGTQSSGGVPTNTDFSGTLSNGQPKVMATFDFENMVANNDAPWSPHGSGVAGVSVALANNPTPANANGVVGSAPNVQIMTITGRAPYIDIEVADQYIWMAGFDPQSPLAGFPASPPANGADVITCSLTPGANATLSGIAQATLDFVTTFGRGGKGTMCFFSTGNANANNVTARPYGAYEKCFAIAATSIANDGVTEIRAPYSGWGQIDFCTPSQDTASTVHNPPAGYRPWSAAHQGQGNLPSNITNQTTLNAAVAAGATSLTLTSVAGFPVNGVIHIGPIGANGSEPARITAVNIASNTITIEGFGTSSWSGGLQNAHTNGDVVVTGPANHRNNFGGTSSATPLAAGVAALVLSADPSLTFIEAREVMRNSAVKLDTGNTTANGQWLDINGDPSVASGQPPVRSGWYGFGRLDAAAAVQGAIDFDTSRDLIIRDNLADNGSVATTGAFWNSPDIWCRTTAPASDPSALPANYSAAGPHQTPIRGQNNWIYLRVFNNGTAASLDGWVRISITHWPGLEFTYPDSWQPTNGPGDPLPSPMAPGTYFIGEVKISGLAPSSEQIVSVEWPANLIPPETVSTSGGDVTWHPCLLAEITPHDGPNPTGIHVWDDNNLAQKNISIIDTDVGTDFRTAIIAGSLDNKADCIFLEINRGKLPCGVQLYVDYMDRRLWKGLYKYSDDSPNPAKDLSALPDWYNLMAIPEGRNIIVLNPAANSNIATLPKLNHDITKLIQGSKRKKSWKPSVYDGRKVVFLQPQHRVQLPVCAGSGHFSPLILGGIIGDNVPDGAYEILLIQRQLDGQISGSATVSLNIGKERR